MGAAAVINKKTRSCRRVIRRWPPTAGINRRVRALKKLIPNGESMGTVEGLFRETADYILGLEMRVSLMQILLQDLTTTTTTTTPATTTTCDSYHHHQFGM